MAEIKACLFDLDGVIVDTAKYHFIAWKRLANELGINFSEHDNEQLKGVSRIESLKLILDWGNITKTEAEILELATLKNEWYLDMITVMKADEVLPGTISLLNELKSAGIKIGLGSASKNSMTILSKINLISLFDTIIDGNTISKSKPDPEVFLKGAEALDVQPSECIVFEDAISGVQAAKAAGMKVVGIGDKSVLSEADIVVENLAGISLQELYNI